MSKKICFVALGSYPIFSSNKNLTYIGGAELQQVLVGTELAKRGFLISFITYNEEGRKKDEFRDIEIIRAFSPSKRMSLFKKARMLWNSLKVADSNVYIQQGGTPGTIAFFCFLSGKKYIKWIASDRTALLRGIGEKTNFLLKIAQYLDIKLASIIIVQNNFQKKIIEKKFKKKCILIKNPIAISNTVKDVIKAGNKSIILWVSTIRSIKQPEVFVKLAEMLPEYKFRMIGGRSDEEPELYDKIKNKAKYISNLEFLGYVSHDEILKHYSKSLIFLNTSLAEGFPNTFLEAWLHYTPVVSLNVNPDEIIDRYKLGCCSKTLDQMKKDITSLITNQELCHHYAKNGRTYVEKNHNLDSIVKKYENLINSV